MAERATRVPRRLHTLMACSKGSTRRRRLRILVFAVVAVLGLFAQVGVRPASTDASWTSADVAKASFTAATLQPPVITKCTYNTGLLGFTPVVVVTWSFPSHDPAYVMPSNAGFATSSGTVAGSALTGLLGASVATNPTSGASVSYTSTVTLPLLSGVLQSSYTVGIQTKAYGWTSAYTTVTASGALLGGNGSCPVS